MAALKLKGSCLVSELKRELPGYVDTPILLTMWLCLGTTHSILNLPIDEIADSKLKLVDDLVKFYKEHRMAPHPEQLLKVLATA